VQVIDRCKPDHPALEPGQEDLAAFLPPKGVRWWLLAPVISKKNVENSGRPACLPAASRVLARLNALGLRPSLTAASKPGSRLHPQGAALPRPSRPWKADYRRVLWQGVGCCFNRLYAWANMPIQRFRGARRQRPAPTTTRLLRASHRRANLDQVMCRQPESSVDWQGWLLTNCRLQPQLACPPAGRTCAILLGSAIPPVIRSRWPPHCFRPAPPASGSAAAVGWAQMIRPPAVAAGASPCCGPVSLRWICTFPSTWKALRFGPRTVATWRAGFACWRRLIYAAAMCWLNRAVGCLRGVMTLAAAPSRAGEGYGAGVVSPSTAGALLSFPAGPHTVCAIWCSATSAPSWRPIGAGGAP